jgi:hypothetical protein
MSDRLVAGLAERPSMMDYFEWIKQQGEVDMPLQPMEIKSFE